MSVFGWSLPPGAANDPNAPYNQTDAPCAVCGGFDCLCPECPVCGSIGDPVCYDGETPADCYQCRMAKLGITTIRHMHKPSHGLVRSREQIAKRAAWDAAMAEEARLERLYGDAELIFDAFGLPTERVTAMTDVERGCWVAVALACPADLHYSRQWRGFCDG